MTRRSSLKWFLPCVLLPAAIAATAAGGRQQSAGPAQKAVLQAVQDWNWGELVRGRTYGGEIELSNQCAMEIRVELLASGLPNLSIQSTATIPARRSIGIPYRITPAAASDPDGTIRGELVVRFPSASEETCPSFRLVHDVSGRVRAATAEDEALDKAIPAYAQLIDACVKWWVSRERHGDRTEEECAPIIRQIVVRSRQVFERHRPDASAALSKVSSVDEIAVMSMAQLSGLRRDIAAALRTRK